MTQENHTLRHKVIAYNDVLKQFNAAQSHWYPSNFSPEILTKNALASLTAKVNKSSEGALTFRQFEGSTVIARVDENARQALIELQDQIISEAKKLGLEDLLIKLPSETFHMTFVDIDPGAGWNPEKEGEKSYPKETLSLRREQVGQAFNNLVETDIPEMHGVISGLGMHVTIAVLVSLPPADLANIKLIENTVKSHTGSNVRPFAGVASLFLLNPYLQDPHKYEQLKNLVIKINPSVTDQEQPIIFSTAEFSRFTDMGNFIPEINFNLRPK